MSVVLVGANPGLQLFDDAGVVAAASLWTVDWSVWGVGTAMIVADRSGWRTIGTDEHLARILLERFTRHFPEFSGLGPTDDITHLDDRVEISSDLFSGLRASGGGVRLRIGGVKDRRQFADPSFPLGDTSLALSNVYLPCELGELSIDGASVEGAPKCEYVGGRWSSTSYLAVAEVWSGNEEPAAVATLNGAGSTGGSTGPRRHLRAVQPR